MPKGVDFITTCAVRYKKRVRGHALQDIPIAENLSKWLELENLLSDRKVELADVETVKTYVEDLQNLLENSSLAERKSFIKSFVREVRVTGTEVLLSYTIPLSAGAASQETLVVPPIVHDGGPFWARTRDLSLIRTAL